MAQAAERLATKRECSERSGGALRLQWHCYLVSKLVHGANLAERIKRRLPTLDETLRVVTSIAKALSYVHDAKSVDAARRASDRFCYNCALYAGDADDEWAGCSVFPGKAVAGAGWCGAWAPKQDS